MNAPPRAPRVILMTVDAVGGVWRYAMDLAAGLRAQGSKIVFAGFGPKPSDQQMREAESVGRVVWLRAPLDWMVKEEAAVAYVPKLIADLAGREGADILHLNLPSQAAGLETSLPVVVVSHSCVVTWFASVRCQAVAEEWKWQAELNRRGLDRANVVLVPSRSHGDLLEEVYGRIQELAVVYNASQVVDPQLQKQEIVFAAARWWDDGKNGAVLDAAAQHVDWPVMMAGPLGGPGEQSLQISHALALGELDHLDTMMQLAQAAIFASPSLYEPFGLAALEAARSRCALVLSDIPTYRELWDGAALFADPRDPVAFADAINRFSHDASLRAAFANRALEVSRRFNLTTQTEGMVRHYHRLLSLKQTLNAAE
ncbi:glycosyltransferase family 4 protein [Pararhizobium arenae]|uniref:glycosyltransferase family 4 protein n=1 Tax=Pararhizobium arenae TaxID=1856850 RepID=UPI000B321558|nr:glycosyltransferase family 4 protein [Pararhizobium arenae]